jgi:hypothetical protein
VSAAFINMAKHLHGPCGLHFSVYVDELRLQSAHGQCCRRCSPSSYTTAMCYINEAKMSIATPLRRGILPGSSSSGRTAHLIPQSMPSIRVYGHNTMSLQLPSFDSAGRQDFIFLLLVKRRRGCKEHSNLTHHCVTRTAGIRHDDRWEIALR